MTLMNVPLMALEFVFPGEAIASTILAPGHWARELLGLGAVSDGVVADQIWPSLGGELAMLLDAAEERVAGLTIVISFVEDVFTMHIRREVAVFESTA